MQRILINSLSVIAVCFAVVQAMAAEKNAKSANDEQIIRQLMQEWADALVKGDQAAIDRITSAHATTIRAAMSLSPRRRSLD